MHSFLFLFAGVTVLACSALIQPAAAACNVRGHFCDYPAWAANAFSSPRERVPDAWLEDAAGPRVDNSPRRTKHRRHRGR